MMGGENSRLPLWLKVAWTVYLTIWAPLYWQHYGAQNFLYFCDLGNLFIGVGLWLESQFIFSWQAAGLLVFQTLYALDLALALTTGHHPIGGTEYMFERSVPLAIRLLGLYHLLVPPLLFWAVRRLGYDPRAWRWQIVLTAIVVPLNYFWQPAYNVNWARGLGHEQHLMPGWLYVAGYLIVVPLVIYWPTHQALKWWAGRAPSRARRHERAA